jgi:predicted nuclease of predicted toxin-antitoxin system
VKFLIDAQLPRRFARWLTEHAHAGLAQGDRTPDSGLVERAVRDARIVVTKDSDFIQTFLSTGQPTLLFISIGNTGNAELENLLHRKMPAIERVFAGFRRIEMTRTSLIVHE